eukprot:scaffold6913_cov169-Ochromonas_danica.AAC.3
MTKALPVDTVTSSPALFDDTRPVSAVICEVIKALCGHRPSPSSNLGPFGLDSLGSAMSNDSRSRQAPAREKLHLISENDAENES